MMRSFATCGGIILLLALTPDVHLVWAKRAVPKPVAPIVYRGITYSAPNDNGEVGYILASDSAGKKLFQIKVFEIEIDPKLERDVQDVFITDLKLQGNSLIVRDERFRCYSVNLETRIVKRDC